ncbi:EFCAB14.2 family protein [Megaselia abdita]
MITMDNLSSRETLKLLKISDDSNKNNSDLDLPEITNQRKRKVRRKHRPRLISSSSSNSNLNHSGGDFHGTKISSAQRKQCSNILFLWFTFIVICWLVTLSYMLAVIHSENLRLQVQIKVLEGSTQNLPEVLQNWHETSKYLQDNQTQINSKVMEKSKEIENLTRKLDQLKLDSPKAVTKENFAAFGAQVKSVSDDVEQLKTRLSDLTTNQKKFTTELETLTDNFNSSLTKITNSSSNGYNVEALNSLESKMQLNYQNLNKTVQSFITTGEQKTKDVTDMFTNNSKALEDLKDKSESMKSHVESMEKDWPSIRDSTFSQNVTITALKASVEELRNTTKFIDSSIAELRSEISKIVKDKTINNDLAFLYNSGNENPPANKEINVHPSSEVISTTKPTTTTTSAVLTTTKIKQENM